MESRSILGKDVRKGDLITRIIGKTFEVIAITPSGRDDIRLFSVKQPGESPASTITVKSHINEIHSVARESWD